MAYWLMKTEPNVFAFEDFLKHPHHRAGWEGVRNYQARNFMRDKFRLSDEVLIYHSSCAEPGVVGMARVVREAYPDVTALDAKSPYFDPKSQEMGQSRWVMVDLEASAFFQHPITLKEIRQAKGLKDMLLVKPGQRLSIQPVAPPEWHQILKMGHCHPISKHPLYQQSFAREASK